MPFRVTETITQENEIEKETAKEFQFQNEMDEWITARKVAFNSERFLATISGQGVEFAKRKQNFTISEI